MCGFAGYTNISNQKFLVDEALLQKMQQQIAHRGPDDARVWLSQEHQLGLAFRRLSIIDLSSDAAQPMFDREQTVGICFNGEMYNHAVVRKELESLGYTYFSTSDTETIIYAYKQWGIDCLHKFEGMFALTIFDLKKRKLFLVRDRMGVKPLYFSLQGGVLSFASEIKALWVLPWMKKKISSLALYHYFTFMVAPAPYTIYEGVYKLPAGFYAELNANKQLSFKEWYSPITNISESEKRQFNREDFCIENIRTLLFESTKKRMVADVPVGAFLSGGIDSSLNVALMAQCVKQIKTFTVSFSDGPEYNEIPWARQVARLFGTEHHEIVISEKEAFDFYERMVYHLDEPLADCVCIPFYYVSQLARDSGIVVAQVGEGADELFFGYPMYARYKKMYEHGWNTSQQFVPASAKRATARLLQPFLANRVEKLSFLDNWVEGRHLFWGGALAFNERQKKMLFEETISLAENNPDHVVQQIFNGMQQQFDSHAIVSYHLDQLKQRMPEADFCTQMLYLELKQRLPELLLMRADKMSMAASVEAREPYLDHKLVEFMMRVPAHLRVKNGVTKYLLKKACEGILPENIIYRKKVGFAAPTFRWFEQGKYFPAYFKTLQHHTPFGVRDDILPTGNDDRIYSKNHLSAAVQRWVLQQAWAIK